LAKKEVIKREWSVRAIKAENTERAEISVQDFTKHEKY